MSDAHTRKSRLTVPSGGGYTGGSSTDAAASSSSSSHHHHRSSRTSSTVPYDWHRLTDVRQMDVQAALDQMKTLLSSRPQAVYKTAYYRKQTKNHWARDDPAFCVLQGVLLVLAGIAYAVAFRAAWTTSISFVLQSLVWNWWGCGLVVAAAGRALANQHLLVSSSSSTTNGTTITTTNNTNHVRQQVEFWYAFDIHCNSFFPVFVLLCKWIHICCCRWCCCSVCWSGYCSLIYSVAQLLTHYVIPSPPFVYHHNNRRSPVLYHARCSRQRLVSPLTRQHLVLCRRPVVLVRDPFRLPRSTLCAAYRSVSSPLCCTGRRLCRILVAGGDGGMEYQRGPHHGQVLFCIRADRSSRVLLYCKHLVDDDAIV